MFDPVEAEKILFLNESTQLKFFESEAPYYSMLSLYSDDQEVSDCSFKPQEKKMIEESMGSYDLLINTLKQINNEVESKSLKEFIDLIEDYKKGTPRHSFNRNM